MLAAIRADYKRGLPVPNRADRFSAYVSPRTGDRTDFVIPPLDSSREWRALAALHGTNREKRWGWRPLRPRACRRGLLPQYRSVAIPNRYRPYWSPYRDLPLPYTAPPPLILV